MERKAAIILIVLVAVVLVILMVIKNKRDRKRIFTNQPGTDPVEEQHAEQQSQRDKL